jgi:hypothetical protein
MISDGSSATRKQSSTYDLARDPRRALPKCQSEKACRVEPALWASALSPSPQYTKTPFLRAIPMSCGTKPCAVPSAAMARLSVSTTAAIKLEGKPWRSPPKRIRKRVATLACDNPWVKAVWITPSDAAAHYADFPDPLGVPR